MIKTDKIDVSVTEQLRVRQDLENVAHLTAQIEEIEAQLKRLSSV